MSKLSIEKVLEVAISRAASDVHIVANKPPVFRVEGELLPSDLPPYSPEELREVMFTMVSEKQKTDFLAKRELDFSYSCMEDFQFRVNFQFERGNAAMTVRIMSTIIRSIEELHLPKVINDLARKRKGLVIVAGTAGCGKSTTLTYMINLINQERRCKIITIEDPIEYIHQSKKSLIVQREIGVDTDSFATALKYAVRQDPDVVVVGEMRDLESISMALTTVETGHLVLTTAHAPDAIETINRIIDAYPLGSRDQVCLQLAGNLLGVISQMLVPSTDAGKRVLVTEVLLSTIAVQNLIRRGAFMELRSQLDSEENPEMYSFEHCLSRNVIDGVITKEVAKEYSKHTHLLKFYDPKDFKNTPSQEEAKKVDSANIDQSAASHQEPILIVEEDEMGCKNMARAIAEVGFTNVSFVINGREVWTNIALRKPKVVILDLGFRNLDSFTLCEQIKNHPQFSCQVILITNRLRSEDSSLARKARADDFVLKTEDFRLLIKALVKLCPSAETSQINGGTMNLPGGRKSL